MLKTTFPLLILTALLLQIASCTKDADDEYEALSPVNVNLATVPYQNYPIIIF